ncbi:hypothetical protein [Candidatus Thiodictyon syntrophicum]|jgi:HTH-type transcriptional regulator/antitoxin HigA|uniref:Uncharacterized protein n=1 Tax=Candidatus Thiodictyon syntrophicum TaxID=1166950 RepID=A0A2K8UE65_9GAMM|nr:hypothetical protein [Candidatus Thiodictyon syntrophicum]AUB83852.1 hypothetical protein THSYN_24840 [Candidatus Thiodictyon syntrophicum]
MTATASLDLKVLQQTWVAFDRLAHLRPIRTEEEYDRTIALLNHLLDVVGEQEEHELSGLSISSANW